MILTLFLVLTRPQQLCCIFFCLYINAIRQPQQKTLSFDCTSLFELTQFSGESCRPSTVGSLMSGTMVSDAGSMHANLKKNYRVTSEVLRQYSTLRLHFFFVQRFNSTTSPDLHRRACRIRILWRWSISNFYCQNLNMDGYQKHCVKVK